MITMRSSQLVMKRYQLELELLDVVAKRHRSYEQFCRQMARVRRAERALEALVEHL
jgi:hypothetical protein